MTEIVFPLFGAALVVLLVLPAFAALAKVGLVMLDRDEAGGPLHRLNFRYLLLTGSSVLPLTWFVSAGLHQAESGKSVIACLFDHDAAAVCFEPAFFVLTLALFVFWSTLTLLREFPRMRLATPELADALRARIEQLVRARPELKALRGRIRVTDEASIALITHGFVRPCVYVGVGFAQSVSEETLASALGHEAEHVRSFDPLRYLILRLALAVNPLGRLLLQPHATRWLSSREAHCDREAVLQGAEPLALADAIVTAARPSSPVALGSRDISVLQFRIGMLLAFAERAPVRCCQPGLSTFPVAVILLLVTLLLPHGTSTAALDVVHTGAEHPVSYFLR